MPPQPQPQRESSKRTSGRLTALQSTYVLDTHDLPTWQGQALFFPAMPDVIELARKTDYAVVNARYAPDGIHIYKSTFPLEIPITFKLASNDIDFCPKGVYSLLQMAALLHSLVLPLGTQDKKVTTTQMAPTVGEPAPAIAGQPSTSSASNAQDPNVSTSCEQDDALRPPVTCALELMWTEAEGPGIVCIGYVKDVSAKFSGPWLRGPRQSFNLPSFCDFSFTFVHAPGYGNDYTKTGQGLGQQVHAYAQYVEKHFYSTFGLSNDGAAGSKYRGLRDGPPEDIKPPNVPPVTAAQVATLPSTLEARVKAETNKNENLIRERDQLASRLGEFPAIASQEAYRRYAELNRRINTQDYVPVTTPWWSTVVLQGRGHY